MNKTEKMLKRGDKVIFTNRYGSERIGRIELIATKAMRIAPIDGSNRVSIAFSRIRKAPIADENQEVIEKVLFTLHNSKGLKHQEIAEFLEMPESVILTVLNNQPQFSLSKELWSINSKVSTPPAPVSIPPTPTPVSTPPTPVSTPSTPILDEAQKSVTERKTKKKEKKVQNHFEQLSLLLNLPAPGDMAITIKQPWAWAIFELGKDIENRTWISGYRGKLWIHAGKAYDKKGDRFIRANFGVTVPKKLPQGAILGCVDLMGISKISSSQWAISGQYHWKISNPQPLTNPIRCNGKQMLWKIK